MPYYLQAVKFMSSLFISCQALGFQRWGPCWPVLKCLITCRSLICLPSSWALSVRWQPAALFSWAKWWETSQYTCLLFKPCDRSVKLSAALWAVTGSSVIVKGSVCASLHHGRLLPEQPLLSYARTQEGKCTVKSFKHSELSHYPYCCCTVIEV